MATACYILFLLEGLSKPQHADQDFKHWWFGLPSCETWILIWNSRAPSHRKSLGYSDLGMWFGPLSCSD